MNTPNNNSKPVNDNSKPVVTRSIKSFSNTKMRDKAQPKEPVMSKSGIKMLHPYCQPAQYYPDSLKVTFKVANESITPPETLSRDILKIMISKDTKAQIDIDQVYTARNSTFTHFIDKDKDLCVIANYSAPYQGIAVDIPC